MTTNERLVYRARVLLARFVRLNAMHTAALADNDNVRAARIARPALLIGGRLGMIRVRVDPYASLAEWNRRIGM